MKRFKSNLTALLTALLLLAGNSNKAYAQEPESLPQATDSEMDSVRISLLTCSPGEQVWALYGHTAIRYENPQKGIDVAVNYGIFNFNKPHFLLRFVFGLTDYEMGVSSFRDFCDEYLYYGRKVTQQVINLNNEQKRRIISALMKNYQPENRVYRYNYFYDNCTTRARDMLLDNLQDSTHQIVGKDYHEEMTFREMVHSYCTARPWARFGNDMLLGVGADRPTTNEEQQFLPANLMEDFDEMLVSDNKTYDAPLVSDKFTVVNPALRQQEDEGGFPFRPRTCAFLLLAVTIVVTLLEYTTKKTYWGYDLLLMLVSGLAGCVLFLMLFSQHPTVRLNLQLLALNPLPLFFAWRAVRRMRRGQADWWWKLWGILIILFFAGALVQDYAEGMMIVACSLLIRCCCHLPKKEK